MAVLDKATLITRITDVMNRDEERYQTLYPNALIFEFELRALLQDIIDSMAHVNATGGAQPGDWIFTTGVPAITDGDVGDFALDTTTNDYYEKVNSSTWNLIGNFNGDSAYQVWLNLGNSGSASDFINSLQGEQGFQGIQGIQGNDGQSASVSVGAVTTGAEGTNASVTNSGTLIDAILNFVIPRGDSGLSGTISIGTVTTGAEGSSVIIQNVGTPESAILNITIPQGDQGIQGVQGIAGDDGQAATLSIGSVTTGDAGSNAIVSNSGTSQAAVLDITIPRGDQGIQGIQGIQGLQGNSGEDAFIHRSENFDADGSTTSFNVSQGAYVAGTGRLYYRGQRIKPDLFTETATGFTTNFTFGAAKIDNSSPGQELIYDYQTEA